MIPRSVLRIGLGARMLCLKRGFPRKLVLAFPIGLGTPYRARDAATTDWAQLYFGDITAFLSPLFGLCEGWKKA